MPALGAPSILPGGIYHPAFRDRVHEDFRLFLTILWQHLLNAQPAELLMDMAGFLQHGPNRSVIMAFRGAAKSWTTGGYGLWRLDRRPQDENILVVSGSALRAVASTNWMLQLIFSWDYLKHLRPKPRQRQSSSQFDVGPASESQSASVFGMGIGGQLVGFRASCIIPDDVETQTNSLTVQGREKTGEAVKEFDSVLKPDFLDAQGKSRTDIEQPVVKYLGTPHDTDSIYNELIDKRGYTGRVWPGEFPDQETVKAYGDRLAPWVLRKMAALGPSCVGKPTMPERFSSENLAKRKLSLGPSEYRLQFMLDTSRSDKNRFPLRLRDLVVLALDAKRGPEDVVWTDDTGRRLGDLPAMGRGQDYFYGPALEPSAYGVWNRIIAGLDISGRGADETALSVVGELNGRLGLLKNKGWMGAGYAREVLVEIAQLLVQYRVNTLLAEDNFGDGMFTALLTPIVAEEWERHNRLVRQGRLKGEEGGTEIIGVRASNQMNKEKRLLSILEPVTAAHRLMVARDAVTGDYESLRDIEGEDTRHRYSLWYQYANLTRDKDSLVHDDRLDSLAIALTGFADILGVDPKLMAQQRRDTLEEELEKLMGPLEDDEYGVPTQRDTGKRAVSLKPSSR